MTSKTHEITPRVIAVLGYGCHLTPVLSRYLDEVSERIGDAFEAGDARSSLLFYSGGFTMKQSAPGVSEARLMADALRARGIDLPVVLDESARTTLENLRNLAQLCRRRSVSAHHVAICCDDARRLKIAHVARRLLGAEPDLWTFDHARSPLQRGIQQSLGLAYDALALRMRWVEQIGLKVIDARNARA